MTKEDLIFSSLMGSGSFKMIERLNLVQNDLVTKGLPTIPFLKTIPEVDRIPEDEQYFPLSFGFTQDSKTKWTFPFEPMVTISGGNTITKVNVSKHGVNKNGFLFAGTSKERIFRNDFDITISGVLMGKQLTGKPEDCFPRTQMIELFNYLVFAGNLFVYSHPLEQLGINHIVIESYSFPFTKGENVQAYEIKALSDDTYNLIVPK